jgi:hypothetical protein
VITPKWPYFQSLLFLKDQFTSRRSTSNLPTTSLGIDSLEDVHDSPESEGAPIPSSADIDEIQGLESQSPVYFDWEPTPQSPISNEQPTVSLPAEKGKSLMI